VHAVCPADPVPAQPAGFKTRPVRKLGRVVCRECGGNHLWNNCPLMAPRKG